METITASYKLLNKIKDDALNVDNLQNYCLCIQIGIRDLQFCVINTTNNKCLLIEDFIFQDVQTINTRLMVVQKLFENHHLLMAGFWHSVKICLKSHKFTLVPSDHFLPEASLDYLSVNSEVKPKTEAVQHYKHIGSNAINIFAADKKLIAWLKTIYKKKEIEIIHQGSALIEGIHRYDDHSPEKGMYCYVDRGVIHLIVSQDNKLLYYNQFAVKSSDDFIRYVMLVFKELGLSQKTSKLIIWGEIKQDSPSIAKVRKYIRNISFGGKPSLLNFSYHFDEISDHQYFDIFSIFLCD
ncbi:MAG: DUF3822 family protein [Bacteroidetes bacterium]|nr:DUF3822 family protein [Bacteroidota bacterium]MDA1120928.1 DUF3822 family protein [Bacteroidota bacterium]